MDNLDDNFELHLNQEIDLKSNNIKVHKSLDRHDIINNLDIGLVLPDKFTSKDKDFNFDILDYCTYGIKILSMNNINNNGLIKKCKNGIIIPYNSSPKVYANNIKKLNKMEIDKNMVIKRTNLEYSWTKFLEKLIFDIFDL
jgi:hypothetical protein